MPDKIEKNKKPARRKPKNTTRRTGKSAPEERVEKTFPIVGLGASAGGLDALKAFFAQVEPDSGMAYIVVVHLTPRQPSLMPELLQKVTAVPVSAARDDEIIEPNHIYVIPPNKEISVFHGRIQLMAIEKKPLALPIDLFLRSLAQDLRSRAVGAILSGTGTDGTLGVKEIKANDGLVLVQSEESAGYNGMPRSAINSGVADAVLPPEAMPQMLHQYFTHRHATLDQKPSIHSDQRVWLNKIFAILRSKIGHDFSQYKVNTLLRRISRRMGLNQIQDHDNYLRFLQQDPGEVEALFRELLIGVTNFFRDAESFNVLKTDILPELIEKLPDDAHFRAWIPGCSTGEEVYSLAIVIRELLDNSPKRMIVQLFGTDIDSYAIDKAREGLFPASIGADVNEERLKRFFTKEGDFFRIRKEIRDCAVFSVQDLIKDPPFSRLHLLCCRNLLIYLDGEAQKKLLPLFHYTLMPKGVLMLGSSESIGGFTNLFKTLNNKWKIYRRNEVPPALRQQIDFPSGSGSMTDAAALLAEPLQPGQKINIGQMTQRIILDQFSPTAVLVDLHGNILHVQGRTGKYLETPTGPPTSNILDLAREGLRIELSSAMRSAKSSNQPVIRKKVAVKTNGDMQLINLHVCPQQAPMELAGRLLVVFEDVETVSTPGNPSGDAGHEQHGSTRISELERELQSTRESHQTTIEELESSNEELKSTNEELQSSNEELQSTNEELESSKEELQSLNEELQTVNAELQSKVDELSAAHDDMRNLLNSTEIATIFVDNHMRVRRFTPEATTIVNLIQTDIGRPLQHVVTNLDYEALIDDLHEVIKNLMPKEVEVKTLEGDWYKMRIIPYRTIDNRIDGAVLTYASINEQKKAQHNCQVAVAHREHHALLIAHLLDLNADPLAVVDDSGKVVNANQHFARAVRLQLEDIIGTDLVNINSGILKNPDLKIRLSEAVSGRENFHISDCVIRSGDNNIYSVTGQFIQQLDIHSGRLILQFVRERWQGREKTE